MALDQGHEEILAVFEAMSRTWNAGDAAGFADFYTDDATVIGPDIYLHCNDTVLPGEREVAPEREHLVTWFLTRQGSRWLVEANHMSPVRLDRRPEEE